MIAGVFVAAIGEGTIYAFEQVYVGNKSVEDIDWVKKLMEGKLQNGLLEKVSAIIATLPENATKNDVTKAIIKLIELDPKKITKDRQDPK